MKLQLIAGDRNVPWRSQICFFPAFRPIKYEATINGRALPETTDPDERLRYIDISSVDDCGRISNIEEFVFAKAPSRARRVPRVGDTIVSTVRTYLQAIAYIDRSDPELVCSTGFAVITPGRRLHSRFLFYWLRSALLINEICARSTGISYPAINASEIGSLPVPVIPLEQQVAIAGYLDRKTAAIDKLIAKKDQLVAALQEKRQAIITNAVTGGAKLINLASHLPSQWHLLQLRRVIMRFIDYRGRTPTKVPSGIPLITAGAVRDGRIDHARAPEYILPGEYEDIMRRGRPELGDLVFTTEAPLGEVGLVEDTNVAFAQRIILFQVDKQIIDSRFLWLYYQSDVGRAEVASRASGSTAEGIRADRLRGSLVIVPPLDAQKRVLAEVEGELCNMQPLQSRIQQQIEKLREYRQALITAAVTGQIDVTREEAA